jgi:light-regulated signal transduction histidine kinase (bacteriophytochrome)
MVSADDDVQELYTSLLANHMARSHELVLLNAHELGRKAVTGGFGVLDLVSMHHLALQDLMLPSSSVTVKQDLGMAAEFLAEILSPFEMMLRGYREANAELMATNKALQEVSATAELANRELEAFSYSVAHDLRAPLRSIDGFSLAVLEDCGERLDENGLQHLRYVREAAQQMSRLIDDLLTLSRYSRAALERRETDVSAIAKNVALRLARVHPHRNVEMIIADGLIADCDDGLLTVALENLIGNAWKYTGKRDNARIEVGSIDERPRAYFVRDNGAGFDMAYASKLFGVFQRLHSAAEFEGTGIGLATVERIVRRHGGQIWAESEVGGGATFYFTLEPGRANGARNLPFGTSTSQFRFN